MRITEATTVVKCEQTNTGFIGKRYAITLLRIDRFEYMTVAAESPMEIGSRVYLTFDDEEMK